MHAMPAASSSASTSRIASETPFKPRTPIESKPIAMPTPKLPGIASVVAACATTHAPPPPATAMDCTPAAIERALHDTLERARRDTPANPGWLLAVRMPRLQVDVALAAGLPDPDAAFRIASVTKTFTAAAILRLVEDHRLALDATLDAVAPAPYPALLRRGGYDPAAMTVRQLLQHTSGLWDYAASPLYQAAVAVAPTRRWSREDQVAFAMAHGEPAPAGGQFRYADTGYVLLGAILEATTGQPLGTAVRELLGGDALGMRTTWFESLEPAPAAARAPQTFHGADLWSLDPSSDLWGGGGLVSTTHDLAVFYEALFGGRVFHDPATLAIMETIPAVSTADQAAMGVMRTESKTGLVCWWHGGFWGAVAITCPALGLTIALTGVEAPEDNDAANSLFRDAKGVLQRCAPAGAR